MAAEKHFTPCRGRNACLEDDTGCRACGRSHEEIMAVRGLTDELRDFVIRMGYTNHREFLEYVTGKVVKKLRAVNAGE